MSSISIPTHLLPADGRFGSGPSRIRAEQLESLSALGQGLLGTSHRQPPVRELVGHVRRQLLNFFGAPAGYEVVLGNGGTTTFWDVASFGLVRERAQLVDSGEFGSKFVAAVAGAPFLAEPQVLRAERGSSRAPELAEGIDTYCWVHNETSTGVLAPVQRVADEGALSVVDGTSAAGGAAIDAGETDVYYFAPQKAFASDGGLWFALLSPAALQRAEELAGRWVPPSLSLTSAIDNSRQDQTLNTPALATLVLMSEQLDWLMDQGGLDFATARTAASSSTLYDWAQHRSFAEPFVKEPALRSPVVGTIDFDESVDAAALAATLRANGIVDTEPYRKLGRNQLRIGMYPAVDPADVEALTACIDYVVEALAH